MVLRLAPSQPALPEAMGPFLLQCLQKDPQKRPQNARVFLENLNEILDENFSLHTPQAPLEVLEETGFSFHGNLTQEIQENCAKDPVVPRVAPQ